MLDRAYARLELKAADDDQRVILGTATTPTPDRVGDIVEPLGVKFKNPLPLLWHHRSDMPVGTVKFDKPTKDGITFSARMPKITEPGPLKDRIDTAWGEIKAGLVRGVSIGFRGLEINRLEDGGLRFVESEVLELSLVSIPAQSEAQIEIIKSIDADILAASGRGDVDVKPNPAGVTAMKSTIVVRSRGPTDMKKPIADQIRDFEATRSAKAARLDEILEAVAEKGETLDAAAKEEHDTIEKEIDEVDEHLKRLDGALRRAKSAAKPVKGDDEDTSSRSRGNGADPIRVSVKPNVEKGTAFVRSVWCKVNGSLTQRNPADVARSMPWHDQTPEVERYLKIATAAGNTTSSTWAGPLVEELNLVSEFAELLTAASIIPRLGLTRVPFNIKVPRETTAASVSWVGEGSVKPVGPMAFDQITLLFNKVAGIVPVTEELFRFSSPAVDAIIRRSLTDAITTLTDRDFLDPTKAEVVGVSPASVTNGVTPITASGTNADALRADLGDLFSEYTTDNQSLANLVLVMTASQAMRIALMRTSLGIREFEGLTRDGGSLEGIPVVVSENIVATGGSPVDGSLIVAINTREILLADDGGVNIDVSREASLQMDTAPDSPETASTIMVSLWQRNMIALKAERFITWKKRRAEAVQFIQNAKYE